jgi:hypothetical protein
LEWRPEELVWRRLPEGRVAAAAAGGKGCSGGGALPRVPVEQIERERE